MKQNAMHKLVAAEQAVDILFDALDNELRDCDEYAVENLEYEDLITSKHAARAALIHIRTAIATVRMVSDEIAAGAGDASTVLSQERHRTASTGTGGSVSRKGRTTHALNQQNKRSQP